MAVASGVDLESFLMEIPAPEADPEPAGARVENGVALPVSGKHLPVEQDLNAERVNEDILPQPLLPPLAEDETVLTADHDATALSSEDLSRDNGAAAGKAGMVEPETLLPHSDTTFKTDMAASPETSAAATVMASGDVSRAAQQKVMQTPPGLNNTKTDTPQPVSPEPASRDALSGSQQKTGIQTQLSAMPPKQTDMPTSGLPSDRADKAVTLPEPGPRSVAEARTAPSPLSHSSLPGSAVTATRTAPDGGQTQLLDGDERVSDRPRSPADLQNAKPLAPSNSGIDAIRQTAVDARRPVSSAGQQVTAGAEEHPSISLQQAQDMVARKPLPASAAALYGRVQLDTVRRQAPGPEVTIAEPKVMTEAAPERLVTPPVRVEQTAIPEPLRMQQMMSAPETREQVSQSLQEQVMRVITRQAVLQGKLQLQLSPRELGQLDIEFSHERGGEVQVAIVAKESATRELLESALPRLRQNLLEAGVQLADLDLRDGQDQPSGDRSSDAHVPTGHVESDETGVPAAPQRTQDGLLSFYV